MANVNIKSQLLDRDEIARMVPEKNFRLIKFFENLLSDVAETIPEAIGGSITGPASSVDGHVATFNGTSGGVIKDSGIPITNLAPLASPTFTGTPTAPTPPALDNSARLATTAFVQGEITGGVKGPVSSTADAIALFNGTTGKIIKDSAVLVTSLAPLASPIFTGDPQAPTAALNDNDTSIATTAFVQNQVESLTAAYFSAHANGTPQSINNATLTKVTLSTELYDVGSKFATSTWTPPARLVSITGAVSFLAVAGTRIGASIFKNGAEFKRGTFFVAGAAATATTAVVSCQDVANGTDTYELFAFQDSGAPQSTLASTTLTYFMGATIRP